MSSPAMARESCWILWPQANEEFVPIQALRKQNHCRTNRTGDKPAAAGTGKERELQSNGDWRRPKVFLPRRFPRSGLGVTDCKASIQTAVFFRPLQNGLCQPPRFLGASTQDLTDVRQVRCQ